MLPITPLLENDSELTGKLTCQKLTTLLCRLYSPPQLEHEHGSSERPDGQHIQREARHSGSFRRRREDAVNKLFTDRARHEHCNEEETTRPFLPRSVYGGIPSHLSVQIVGVRRRRLVF